MITSDEKDKKDRRYKSDLERKSYVTSKKFDKQHIPFSEFGKTIFLTREEADKALKERENNGKL